MAITLCIFTAHESPYTENPTATCSEAPPPPLIFRSLIYFLCQSASYSLLFQLFRSQTMSVPWSCSVCTPAAQLKHVLLIQPCLCPSFFAVLMTATLSLNCFTVIPSVFLGLAHRSRTDGVWYRWLLLILTVWCVSLQTAGPWFYLLSKSSPSKTYIPPIAPICNIWD